MPNAESRRAPALRDPSEPHHEEREVPPIEAPVLVLGLGEVGRPLLELLAKAHQTAGKDLDDRVVRGVRTLHVCFPFGPQFVQTACDYVSEYRPEVVVVNSTVVPGTTRAIQDRTETPTVYSPVRGKHAKMDEELLRYRKFVAGTSPEAVAAVRRHFEAAGIPTDQVSSFEVLELAKLLETSYFGVLIAWAQEMDRFAHELDVDYWEALRFVDEIDFLPAVGFEPGYIGGHCVMPNLELLEQVRPSAFIDAIRRSNDRKGEEWREEGRPFSQRVSPRARVATR